MLSCHRVALHRCGALTPTRSRKYHPDRLGPNPPRYAEERFIAIRQAYEILTDPVKRFAYDR
jgi:curved DNA-binding protein CbpA